MKSHKTKKVKKLSKYVLLTSAAYVFIAVALIGFTLSLVNNKLAPGKTTPASSSAATTCTVDSNLVNSCRPWLAAAVNGYPQVGGDQKSQILYHEQRIGRQLDVVHTYHHVGSNTLSSADIYFANRANTILATNWKPTDTWSQAAGGNASVNAAIDSMAKSVKSVAPHKVLFALYHEPENNVSNDPNCPNTKYKGNSGTPTDYRNMWANVENRFAADGVTNVVWNMNYMGYSGWSCIFKDLWPGNNLVDWVTWDPYPSGGSSFDAGVNYFYNWMTANNSAQYNFTSKPWGINEWGVATGASQQQVYNIYDEANTALDQNTFPRIKLYDIFDTNIPVDLRILYNHSTHTVDQAAQNHYNGFANDAHINGSSTASGGGTGGGTGGTGGGSGGGTGGGTGGSGGGSGGTGGGTQPPPPPSPSFVACSGGNSSTNLALNRPVEVSSVQSGTSLSGCKAVDGSNSFGATNASDSRWSSDYSDPQWLTVDLGSTKSIGSISINWEFASAQNYLVQVGNNNENWQTVNTVTGNGTGSTSSNVLSGVRTFTYNGVSGRYVRIYGSARSTGYGYSIVELTVQPPNNPPTPPVIVHGSGGTVDVRNSRGGVSGVQPQGSTNPLTITVDGGGSVPIAPDEAPILSGRITVTDPSAKKSGGKTTIYIDGIPIGVSDSDNIDINTQNLPNGNHQLELVTTYPDGTTAVTGRNITVNNTLNPVQAVRNNLYLAFHGNIALADTVTATGGTAVVGAATFGGWKGYMLLLAKRALGGIGGSGILPMGM